MTDQHTFTNAESLQPNLLDSQVGKAFAGAVIVTEVSPLNEMLRGAITVGAGIVSKDPLVTAGVFAASTALIEGTAAMVTAEALSTNYGKDIVKKVNSKLLSVGVNETARTNTLTDFGISMLGGSAVSMLVKQAQDPERTKAENRMYGAKMTVAVSSVCGGLGYAAAEGIVNPGADTIGITALAVSGVGIFMGWAKRKVSQ